MIRGTHAVTRAPWRVIGCLCLPLTVGSCADAPTLPPSPARTAVAARRELPTTLMPCPSVETRSATATVGPDGGVVRTGGSSVVVPRGALDEPVEITLALPESDILEAEISVGNAASFAFRRPVTVHLDYARCGAAAPPGRPLVAWHIDPASRELLEPRVVVRQRGYAVATFAIDHLSTYALAH